jgi:hypothetical protein
MMPQSSLEHVQARDVPRWRGALARCVGVAALALAGATVSGCAAEVVPAPAAPVDYYYYPYTYYEGHIVYNVNGSWYYPYGNRWYYYRHVPPALAGRSGSLQYYRPPYYRATPYARPGYTAPPAYRPNYRAPYGRGGGPVPYEHRR